MTYDDDYDDEPRPALPVNVDTPDIQNAARDYRAARHQHRMDNTATTANAANLAWWRLVAVIERHNPDAGVTAASAAASRLRTQQVPA